jgi:hypothetical protein
LSVSESPVISKLVLVSRKRSSGKTDRLRVGVTVTTAASVPLERKTDMHTLTFNDNERTLLIATLDAYLATLPHEIHQTDNHAYRAMLEEKQSTLQQLMKRLQES